MLNRRAPVPDIHDQIYAHDPIGKWVLAALKRAACVEASILGQGEVDDTEGYSWVVCETNHPKCGSEIDETMLQTKFREWPSVERRSHLRW